MSHEPSHDDGAICLLEDVLITDALAQRPARAPDYEGEARALGTLARGLAANPRGLLQRVVETALTLCRAGSAGVSVLEDDGEEEIVRWPVVAGASAAYLHHTIPRESSPCGVAMRGEQPVLYDRAERHFGAMREVEPRSYENLIAPWRIDGRPAGTLWVSTHSPERQFDAEDARLLTSLACFASAAWRTVLALESALRESEARFRSLANLVPDLLWQGDPDGSTVWCNDRWYSFTGMTPEQTLGAGLVDAIHPDDRAGARRAWEIALQEGRPFARENRIRGHDGVYCWFLVRADPMLDGSGRVVRWFGAATDVNAQRLAMEEITQRVTMLHRQLTLTEEEERRRLARELHDEVGQHLTALGLGLHALSDVAPPDSDVDRRATQLRRLADTLGRELHGIAVRLRPVALDDFGLEEALRSYAVEWSHRSGIALDLHVQGSERLPSEVESAVYRIVQEALTNIARHSGAGRAGVVLERRGAYVHVIVEDDGRGFEPADAARTPREGPPALGLLGIRERTALLGGTLDIESAPEGGTVLFVRVPIEQPRVAFTDAGRAMPVGRWTDERSDAR